MKNLLFYLVCIGLAILMAGHPSYFEKVTGINPDPLVDNFIYWLFALLLLIPFLPEWISNKRIPRPLSRKAAYSLMGFILMLVLIAINPVLTRRFDLDILGVLRPFLYLILFIWIIYDAIKAQKTPNTREEDLL